MRFEVKAKLHKGAIYLFDKSDQCLGPTVRNECYILNAGEGCGYKNGCHGQSIKIFLSKLRWKIEL